MPMSMFAAFLFLAMVSATPPRSLWVSEKADQRLWRDIRTAFKEETLPDDPQNARRTWDRWGTSTLLTLRGQTRSAS